MNSVTFAWPPKELSPNARGHWSKKSKAAKAYRVDCFYLTKEARVTARENGPRTSRYGKKKFGEWIEWLNAATAVTGIRVPAQYNDERIAA